MGAAAAVAGIGAVASVGGSLLSSGAAKSAANTQAAAANRAADLQLQQQERVRGDLQPYRDTGAGATNRLSSLYNSDLINVPTGNVGSYLSSTENLPNGYKFQQTDNGLNIVDSAGNLHWGNVSKDASIADIFHSVAPGSDPSAILKHLEATPGYQFTLGQGLKSVQNSAAARGLGTSGAALKGAAQYATGLAQNTVQQNLLNPLQYLGTLGEAAAAQTGTLGTQAAQAAGSGIVGAGNALASGTVGSANALGNGLGQLGSAPLNYQLYSKLLGGGGNAGSAPGYFDTPGGQPGGGFSYPNGNLA